MKRRPDSNLKSSPSESRNRRRRALKVNGNWWYFNLIAWWAYCSWYDGGIARNE